MQREVFLMTLIVGERLMTPEQIRLVKASLPAILQIREVAADLFYERLFELDATTRPLFAGADMRAQGAKLMSAIGMVVGALDRFDTIRPHVQELALRHMRYGVLPPHYDSVGAALLWTLERGLGVAFTPELREAWTAAYAALSGAMRGAGESSLAA